MSASILDVLKWAGSNVSLILSSIKTGLLCLNVCFPYALECVNYRAWAARKQRLDECFELQVSRITLACTVCDFFFIYTLWWLSSLTHSLTHPLHPGWNRRLQSNVAIQPCPELWTQFLQVFHHYSPPGGFWLALFPLPSCRSSQG